MRFILRAIFEAIYFLQVTVEATQEHPFFVIGQGWSSYNPEKTKLLYGLNCNKLKTKDCCISLTSRGGLTNHLADAAVNGHCTNVVVSAPSNQKISPKIKVNNKFSFQNITGAASPIKQNTTVKTGSVSCNGHSTATTINSAVTANVGHKRKNRNINDLAEDLSISAATHQQQGISKTKKFKSPEIVVAPKSSTTNKNFQHRRSSTPILVENRKPSTGRRFSVS
uniref:AXH domain-containing protein n=1 Tax=Romanomermis culicivorax TaxID=13658 RepID=A0A915HL99_ROMCU